VSCIARGRPSQWLAGLDGLRALAVTAVVVFHFAPTVLPGGFLGVDLFFVISGYLITRMLLAEIDATGRISARDFYLRRIRRLLPAVVTSANTLVEHGPAVTVAQTQAAPALAIVNAHPQIFAELNKFPPGKAPADVMGRAVQEVGPADLAVVQKASPQLAVLTKYGTKVQKAAHDGPSQWRTWWWICVGGQVLFLPFVFLMTGRWSPKRARQDADEHQAAVDREMAALSASA